MQWCRGSAAEGQQKVWCVGCECSALRCTHFFTGTFLHWIMLINFNQEVLEVYYFQPNLSLFSKALDRIFAPRVICTVEFLTTQHWGHPCRLESLQGILASISTTDVELKRAHEFLEQKQNNSSQNRNHHMMLLPNTTNQQQQKQKAPYEGKASESNAFQPGLDSQLQGPNGRYKQGLRVCAGDVGLTVQPPASPPSQDLALSSTRHSTD